MNIQDILTIYEYNYWANKRILAASEKVTEKQFLAPAIFSVWRIARHDLSTSSMLNLAGECFSKQNNWSAPELKAEPIFQLLHAIQARCESRRKRNARLSRHSKRQRDERS